MILSRLQLFYKNRLQQLFYFEVVAWCIKRSLSEEPLNKLTLFDREETYDLWEQICLRFIDNRYLLFARSEEIIVNVKSFLEKYKFLLDSNLDRERVRNIFVRALMDCISVGSGVFFSAHDFHFIKFPLCGHGYRYSIEPEKRFRLWKMFRKDFQKICNVMNKKYPNIPRLRVYKNRYVKSCDWDYCEFTEQLLLAFAYTFRKLLKYKQINLVRFGQEFFRRARWYLENLNQCSIFFVNKYKEGVFRELSSALGIDVDRAYLSRHCFVEVPEGKKYKNKNDLSEFISSLFTEEELKLLELKDAQGNIWSFKDQVKDRYYSKYPSFVSQQEIEENIKNKVGEYRPLLNANTVVVIKDILLDEIERECFVSQNTYLWNREMARNLEKDYVGRFGAVSRAINILISMLPKNAIKQLSMEINGRVVYLKEQLLARWNRAWFGCSIAAFKKYLSCMHLYTPYTFEYWRNKPKISRTDLQAFLEEIDMFFLYPHQWRIVKKLLFRLDNGRSVGIANMRRVNLAMCEGVVRQMYAHRSTIRIAILLPLLLLERYK